MYKGITEKARELMASGEFDGVFAWCEGDFTYDTQPKYYKEIKAENIYTPFCGANLSKSLINFPFSEKRTAVLLKPCDSRAFKVLTDEHRINRDKIYAIGVPCQGMADIDKIKALGIEGILSISYDGDFLTVHTLYGDDNISKKSVLLDKCLSCKSKEHEMCDEVLFGDMSEDTYTIDPFEDVEKLEKKTPDERFAFWQRELSRCIRCNACRNVCPCCSCIKCVFDNNASSVASKANANEFEEKLFHIIRSFHVAGRCIDCGECSRVCPEKIPLHLLNRKFIKDISYFYGQEDSAALLTFEKDDPEPSSIKERSDING